MKQSHEDEIASIPHVSYPFTTFAVYLRIRKQIRIEFHDFGFHSQHRDCRYWSQRGRALEELPARCGCECAYCGVCGFGIDGRECGLCTIDGLRGGATQ